MLRERKVKNSPGARCQKRVEYEGSGGSMVNSPPIWSGRRRRKTWEIGHETKPRTKRHPKLRLGLNGTYQLLFRLWYGPAPPVGSLCGETYYQNTDRTAILQQAHRLGWQVSDPAIRVVFWSSSHLRDRREGILLFGSILLEDNGFNFLQSRNRFYPRPNLGLIRRVVWHPQSYLHRVCIHLVLER